MKLSLTVAAFFLSLGILTSASTVLGQQISCSCKIATDNTCHGEIKCPGGCTAICGIKEECYLACRSDLVYVRVSVKFEKATGEEIATTLSDRTHRKIQFKPYPRNANKRYTLEIKGDDIWHALAVLDKLGNVKVGGVDFGTLRILRNKIRGKKVSVNFTGIPARDALDKLAFVSGFPFRVKSGNPDNLVSLSLKEATLKEIIRGISTSAGVVVEKRKSPSR
jgi:hypothetical protein